MIALLISFVFFFTGPLQAAGNSLMEQADILYASRANPEQTKQAYLIYGKILQDDPQNVEAYWKSCRAAWWTGTRLTGKQERLDYFRKAIAAGEEAVKRQPDSVPAHFWLGGSYASFGNDKGAFTSLRLIKTVRQEMSEVLKRDPPYMGGGADRILGILDYKVPALIGGSKKRAYDHLKQALDYDPANPVTLFYLADYFHVVGDDAQAKTFLGRMRQTTPSPDFAAEKPLMEKQAQDLDKQLQ